MIAVPVHDLPRNGRLTHRSRTEFLGKVNQPGARNALDSRVFGLPRIEVQSMVAVDHAILGAPGVRRRARQAGRHVERCSWHVCDHQYLQIVPI